MHIENITGVEPTKFPDVCKQSLLDVLIVMMCSTFVNLNSVVFEQSHYLMLQKYTEFRLLSVNWSCELHVYSQSILYIIIYKEQSQIAFLPSRMKT